MNTEPTKLFRSSRLLLKTLNLYQPLVKKHKGCNYQLLKGVTASQQILLRKDRGQLIQIPITCFTPAKIFQPPGRQHAYSNRTCACVSFKTAFSFSSWIRPHRSPTPDESSCVFVSQVFVWSIGSGPSVQLTYFTFTETKRKEEKEICFFLPLNTRFDKRNMLFLLSVKEINNFALSFLNLSARCGNIQSVAKLDLYQLRL